MEVDNIEKDGKLYQVLQILRSSRLRSSILQNNISEIGKIKEYEREVNLNADKKRLWFKEIRNIEDKIMIDSMPISMNYFDKNHV